MHTPINTHVIRLNVREITTKITDDVDTGFITFFASITLIKYRLDYTSDVGRGGKPLLLNNPCIRHIHTHMILNL